MLSETDVEDHYNPSVRLIEIEKNSSQCGFHLTRGKWDPYPWVSSVDKDTAAASAGMRPGDCLIEVNGEDVIGQRISEIAEIVKSKPGQVSLLLWNAGVDPQCTPEALCCGPLPKNLQRLSACMTTILAFLECPVCLDTISPPTYQCDNGHLICIRCRTKSERCPVCRLRFSRGRSLLSDQVYNALIDAFDLREDADESRGEKIQRIFKYRSKKGNIPDIKVTQSYTNKFLAKVIGKSTSVDNLSTSAKLLTPNANADESYFNSNHLKTKSLSTNEIFQAESPVVSRSGSFLTINRNDMLDSNLINTKNCVKRPSSYHGSFESLEKRNDVDPTGYSSLKCLNELASEHEDVSFYCPFASNCLTLIKGMNVIEHFQLTHSENIPLIQYFSPNIKIYLKSVQEEDDICYMVTIENKVFFLKININKNIKDDNMCFQDVLIWAWFLGSKETAKEYELQVQIKTDNNEVLLSVRSLVFSLSSVSLKEITDMKKGVFLSSKTLTTLEFPSRKLLLDINILKDS